MLLVILFIFSIICVVLPELISHPVLFPLKQLLYLNFAELLIVELPILVLVNHHHDHLHHHHSRKVSIFIIINLHKLGKLFLGDESISILVIHPEHCSNHLFGVFFLCCKKFYYLINFGLFLISNPCHFDYHIDLVINILGFFTFRINLLQQLSRLSIGQISTSIFIRFFDSINDKIIFLTLQYSDKFIIRYLFIPITVNQVDEHLQNIIVIIFLCLWHFSLHVICINLNQRDL